MAKPRPRSARRRPWASRPRPNILALRPRPRPNIPENWTYTDNITYAVKTLSLNSSTINYSRHRTVNCWVLQRRIIRRLHQYLKTSSAWIKQYVRPTLLYSIIYSIVIFPLTPKYVTLNDPEWRFYVKLFFRIQNLLIYLYG